MAMVQPLPILNVLSGHVSFLTVYLFSLLFNLSDITNWENILYSEEHLIK